jgi:microcystin-dependent protein
MSQPFLGQITVFPYGFAPLGWADCAGQILPISQYAALFSLLGTFYGGNGTSNFALPDLRGRIPLSQGQGPGLSSYAIGQSGGVETVSLLPANVPSHSHTLFATTAPGTTNTAAANLLSAPQKGSGREGIQGKIYNPAAPDTALAPQAIGLAGSNQPHNNVQPFLVLRYCIALSGVFPQRS